MLKIIKKLLTKINIIILSVSILLITGCFSIDDAAEELNITQNISKSLQSAEESTYQEYNDITFTSYDGTVISASMLVPDADASQKLPAIIFMHGWAGNKNDLKSHRESAAKKGYISIGYTARGFGLEGENGSKGNVAFGGMEDIEDFKACIDYLVENTNVDVENIGALGYSYGGGIILKALAFDERLKTVISRNPWTDQVDQQYGGETVRMAGISILDSGATKFPGYFNSEGKKRFEDFKMGTGIEETIEWLSELSPVTYVDMINSRSKKPSVYIRKGLGDFLLHPNAIIRYFEKLEVPKKLYLNRAVHGTDALVQDPIKEFDLVMDWFDHHLKGVENGIMNDTVGIVSYNTENKEIYLEKYRDLPFNNAEIKTLHMGPRFLIGNGSLNEEHFSEYNFKNWIETCEDESGISTGKWDGPFWWYHFNIPTIDFLRFTNHERAVVYESKMFGHEMKIRGIPRMNLWISSDKAIEKLQVIAYLYEIDENGRGALISHGPATVNYAEPGKPVELSIELMALAHDIKAGHGIAVAIDTKDPLFLDPTPEDYRVNFHLYSDPARESKIEIPYLR